MKRITGALFILVAAILYSIPYICSSVYMSQFGEYSSDQISLGINYVGGHFFLLSAAAFIVGIIYIVLAELDDRKNTK